MRSARIFAWVLALAVAAPTLTAQSPPGRPVESTHFIHGDLDAFFRDNKWSPGALSGLDSLFNVKAAPGFDAFDPDDPGASAGLNFEHVISGHQDPHNAFSPRHGRYDLYRLPDGHSVMLVRKPEDSPWSLASSLKYTVREPHYIDFEFKCTPRNADRFGRRGYGILFFANYMNDVAEVPIHFRGVERTGGQETWIAADAPKGHPAWNGGGTYRSLPARDLEYDADHNWKLNVWSYDWPRFTKPFYYGRAANGMVFMLMFDRMHSEDDEIRFSIFKFKLDKHPRPAWDFQYVIHQVRENQEYGFRGRLVWKRFVSPEDCLNEYEQWAAQLERKQTASLPASRPE